MAAKIIIYSKLGVSKSESYNYTYSGTHMGERKLTVEVESPTPIAFAIGDYADLDLTYSSEKFYLHSIPIGNRVHDSLMIKYNLVFWWRGYELKTIAFLDYVDGTESDDAYNRNTGEVVVNGTIVQLMDRIKANMNRAFAGGWYDEWNYLIDPLVDVTAVKEIILTNQYCWDALQLVYSLFGVEYRIEFDDRVILVGYHAVPVEYDSEVFDFEFGYDKGLCEITRLENTEQLVTRVFAYGSTRNITPSYRSGLFGHGYSPRLMLPLAEAPDGYIANATLEATYGIREGFYINEDIFPSITGLENDLKKVDAVVDRPETETPQYETIVIKPASSKKVWDSVLEEYIILLTPAVTQQVLVPTQNYDTFTVYIDGTLPNITDENLQSGATAKISFTTGLLTGNDFEIVSYEKYMTNISGVPTWDDGTVGHNQYYKVVLKRINNDDNYVLPNSVITPAVGDEFVFLDIYLPSSYEEDAEDRLYTDTVAWLAQHSGEPLAYSIRVPEEFVETHLEIQFYLRESNSAKITDTILGVDATYLIQSISIDWKMSDELPTYNLTLSDKPIQGRIQQLESALKSANHTINVNNSKTTKNISNAIKSVTITNQKIFNNNGNINGEIIAPYSILPISFVTDYRSTRYMLSAYLQINYNYDENSAYGSDGILIHKDSDIVWGGIFDFEHQTWTISTPQIFDSLDPDLYYWVYIKGDLTDGTATWVLSETPVDAESVDGYLMFEWGQVFPVNNGSRIVNAEQPSLTAYQLDPPQEFEFADIVAGTAKDYTLVIKAKFRFKILGVCLETDNGTLTGVSVKINSTAVTSLSSLTVDTAVDETDATAANIVEIGDRVYLSVSTGYSGTPTLIRGSLVTMRL